MNIAIIGCGYVADFYMATLPNHPNLRLIGAFDRNVERKDAFARHHKAQVYETLEALLADPQVELILNLTNPGSHFEITQKALHAGKHVYSEKPLAMRVDQAEELVALAERSNLSLSGAPASVLGETAVALRAAVTAGRIGAVRLVYAELEDGPVYTEALETWKSASGAPWPAKDEFVVGCTLEHAGYYLTWLCVLFGPVKRMTAFSSRRVDDKGQGQDAQTLANDFSTACLEFASGVVARLTCGLVAPQDRAIHLIGEGGILTVTDAWNSQSPVLLRTVTGEAPGMVGRIQHKLRRALPGRFHLGTKIKPAKFRGQLPPYPSQMDFARGPAAQAAAIASQTEPLLSARFVLHITEVALAMQGADHGSICEFTTRF